MAHLQEVTTMATDMMVQRIAFRINHLRPPRINDNILYNNPFTRDYLDRINPTNIQSVNVVKTAEEILRYTNKKVAGIIIIQLKK